MYVYIYIYISPYISCIYICVYIEIHDIYVRYSQPTWDELYKQLGLENLEKFPLFSPSKHRDSLGKKSLKPRWDVTTRSLTGNICLAD